MQSETSIEVAAPPDAVYAMVADVTRIPEWSPECHSVAWKDGSTRAEPGAQFVGKNKFGMWRWSTTCVVEAAEPGRELTWSTVSMGRKNTRWSYRFEPAGGGTRVTESYASVEPYPKPIEALLRVMFRRHDHNMPENIRQSLERFKRVAESDAGAAPRATTAPPSSTPAAG